MSHIEIKKITFYFQSGLVIHSPWEYIYFWPKFVGIYFFNNFQTKIAPLRPVPVTQFTLFLSPSLIPNFYGPPCRLASRGSAILAFLVWN